MRRRLLSIDDLSREGRRLKVLSRDADQSVRAVLNTVLDRLDEYARLVYAAFGQHAGTGDVSLAALVAACGLDPDDVRDAVEVLCRARLVRIVGEDRYLADGLVREHSRSRFPEDGAAHLFDDFYLRRGIAEGWAVRHERRMLEALWPAAPREQPSARSWAWLAAERANLRAAANRLHANGSTELCRLAVALWPFHDMAKHVDDMDVLNRCAAEIAFASELPDVGALALVQRGFAFRHRGEHDKAVELFTEGAERCQRFDIRATALESLGLALRDRGDLGPARDALRRNLRMAERIEDERRIALACMHLGSVEDLGECWELLEVALEHFAQREPFNAAKVRRWRGRRRSEAGRHEEARADLETALDFMIADERFFEQAQIRCDLADNALATTDVETARAQFRAAVELCQARGFAELGMRARASLDRLGDS